MKSFREHQELHLQPLSSLKLLLPLHPSKADNLHKQQLRIWSKLTLGKNKNRKGTEAMWSVMMPQALPPERREDMGKTCSYEDGNLLEAEKRQCC